ncbi:IS701 family transposase [uncultured Candidatus Kuenenia sp.]|uniref:IS701 family transposase n=1 Tax=uncultured Candidatus Kuenenia sp. TaxID=1048336 RepID=UPI0025DF402B|nr:IS701 family transposase [uncultured Candidatus Kuenenia sp.]
MSIFSANIPLLNTFLKNFASCFSTKQMAMFTLVIYALFKDYKRNSLEVMAKATHTDYQKLQYFFSDSKWDTQALKRIRLEIIQKQRTTAPAKDGLLAIDDTGCPKPFAKKTEGAKLQYCGPLKRKEVCNVGVSAAFVSDSKHFPIDIIPYLPAREFPRGKNNSQFKDKIQIALELFDLYAESFALSGIVFDSWYATTRFLTHIHKKGKIFYSEIKSNRNIFMRHPVKKNQCLVKPDELVTLIKKHFWDKIKFVKFKTTDGSEVSHKTYSFEAKLNDCDVPIKFVIIFGKWNKDDDYTYHILVTNNLRASAKMVITNYLLRWGIEHGFKELKDTFYFDHYQVRHINKIDRYWNLCLVAWTLTYWIKQNAYLTKILETKPTTFNEIKQAVNSMLEFASTNALSKNENLAHSYFKIKSKRLKKKCAA